MFMNTMDDFFKNAVERITETVVSCRRLFYKGAHVIKKLLEDDEKPPIEGVKFQEPGEQGRSMDASGTNQSNLGGSPACHLNRSQSTVSQVAGNYGKEDCGRGAISEASSEGIEEEQTTDQEEVWDGKEGRRKAACYDTSDEVSEKKGEVEGRILAGKVGKARVAAALILEDGSTCKRRLVGEAAFFREALGRIVKKKDAVSNDSGEEANNKRQIQDKTLAEVAKNVDGLIEGSTQKKTELTQETHGKATTTAEAVCSALREDRDRDGKVEAEDSVSVIFASDDYVSCEGSIEEEVELPESFHDARTGEENAVCYDIGNWEDALDMKESGTLLIEFATDDYVSCEGSSEEEADLTQHPCGDRTEEKTAVFYDIGDGESEQEGNKKDSILAFLTTDGKLINNSILNIALRPCNQLVGTFSPSLGVTSEKAGVYNVAHEDSYQDGTTVSSSREMESKAEMRGAVGTTRDQERGSIAPVSSNKAGNVTDCMGAQPSATEREPGDDVAQHAACVIETGKTCTCGKNATCMKVDRSTERQISRPCDVDLATYSACLMKTEYTCDCEEILQAVGTSARRQISRPCDVTATEDEKKPKASNSIWSILWSVLVFVGRTLLQLG